MRPGRADVAQTPFDSFARPFILLVLAGCAGLSGCASSQPAEPPLAVTVKLDREVYRIGEPLVATVRLTNRGPRAASILRFDHQALTFVTGLRGLNTRVHVEPVFSAQVVSQARQLGPAESTERPFLFTRATATEGEYVLLVGFKGAVVDDAVLPDTFYAPSVPFQVTKEVLFQRDPASGLILKAQALELARQQAGGQVTEARAVLVPRQETGLFAWIVFLRVQAPGGEQRRSLEVDPYTGKVKQVELLDSGRTPDL